MIDHFVLWINVVGRHWLLVDAGLRLDVHSHLQGMGAWNRVEFCSLSASRCKALCTAASTHLLYPVIVPRFGCRTKHNASSPVSLQCFHGWYPLALDCQYLTASSILAVLQLNRSPLFDL